jgi:hypothetical protein
MDEKSGLESAQRREYCVIQEPGADSETFPIYLNQTDDVVCQSLGRLKCPASVREIHMDGRVVGNERWGARPQ